MSTMLFFDDWCLDSYQNIVRRLGRPQWVPEATLTDGMTCGIYNFPLVFRDGEKWKGLYQGIVENEKPVLLIAESDDGIHWRKPDLSSIPTKTSRRATNEVFHRGNDYDRAPAYFDSREKDPSRRIKAVTVFRDGKTFTEGLGVSADGIHWEFEPYDRGGGHTDSPYCIFYNKKAAKYVVVTRPGPTNRRIAFTETTDFHSFSDLHVVLHPDPLDEPLVQFYGMPVFEYEDMYIGLLWLLHCDPDEIGFVKRLGLLDSQLTYSYDGMMFNRTFREPFIPRNQRGEHGGGCIYPSSMVVDDEHRIRIYSGGSYGEHYLDLDQEDAALMLHTLRLDGFMYLECQNHVGTIMTRCIRLRSSELKLNVRAPFGKVRVQLSDEKGIPLPGFSFDECVPFRGDELWHVPTWNPKVTPATLPQEKARIEVELTNAEIYAIRGDFDFHWQ